MIQLQDARRRGRQARRMDGAWIGSIDISTKKAFTGRLRHLHQGSRHAGGSRESGSGGPAELITRSWCRGSGEALTQLLR